MYARRLLIDSVHNMRELGGYATTDGQMTGWKRFIRSDSPLKLTEADVQFLYGYGVRTVIDLRQPEESALEPSLLSSAEGFTFHNISFTDDFSLLGGAHYCPKDHLVPVMQGTHRAAEVLRVMANAESAVLFYCFAGKDRTGIISALLLLLAGVPVPDVLADYQVTYTYIQSKLAAEFQNADVGRLDFMIKAGGSLGERPEHLRRTEPEWLMPLIDYINGFGGAAGYMRHIGLSDAEIALLRQKLLA